jgi:hypothetical protein
VKTPLKNYTPIVPKIMRLNMKRIIMLTIEGSEFNRVFTSPAIPGIELIVRRGRRILITRTAEIFYSLNWTEIHPRITTEKSS